MTSYLHSNATFPRSVVDAQSARGGLPRSPVTWVLRSTSTNGKHSNCWGASKILTNASLSERAQEQPVRQSQTKLSDLKYQRRRQTKESPGDGEGRVNAYSIRSGDPGLKTTYRYARKAAVNTSGDHISSMHPL